jgi:hypothetical protein
VPVHRCFDASSEGVGCAKKLRVDCVVHRLRG